jgi:hypothetical protein
LSVTLPTGMPPVLARESVRVHLNRCAPAREIGYAPAREIGYAPTREIGSA